ncbi:protein MpROS1x [Marchantia polymorpha subsp. ruderalis]|uniref:HhH-GPD domain-containing protein n=1 Tax=Marchantia polymorpha TaxID=3197 RepID=A0A2R6XFG3_MARPO|nr:hypothetical protein MARPO_0018s0032 [Marchantia polymorpha]|eukprot:PTQ44842.1 hypothetical protein MARPO_0018s0032 [Marchantia polymorpha]
MSLASRFPSPIHGPIADSVGENSVRSSLGGDSRIHSHTEAGQSLGKLFKKVQTSNNAPSSASNICKNEWLPAMQTLTKSGRFCTEPANSFPGFIMENCNCLLPAPNNLDATSVIQYKNVVRKPTTTHPKFWTTLRACMAGWSQNVLFETSQNVDFCSSADDQDNISTESLYVESGLHAAKSFDCFPKGKPESMLDSDDQMKISSDTSFKGQADFCCYYEVSAERKKRKGSAAYSPASDSDFQSLEEESITFTEEASCKKPKITCTDHVLHNAVHGSTVLCCERRQLLGDVINLSHEDCDGKIWKDKLDSAVLGGSSSQAPDSPADSAWTTILGLPSLKTSSTSRILRSGDGDNVAGIPTAEEVQDTNTGRTEVLKTIADDMSSTRKSFPLIGPARISKARLEQTFSCSNKDVEWEPLRLRYAQPEEGVQSEARSSFVENGVNWEAVREAKLEEMANIIKERGINYVLAGRIKAFLDRVKNEHGSLNLQWLKAVPAEKSKSFLLSVRGLGLKSVECIRLLALHQPAFPVDTNVGRICVRLGWVPLETLPTGLYLHTLRKYPREDTVQRYLWPRLCTLPVRTLYHLHCQMITFGKVFCTKTAPNCEACPLRGDCEHYASAAGRSANGDSVKSLRLLSSIDTKYGRSMSTPLMKEEVAIVHETYLNARQSLDEEPPSPQYSELVDKGRYTHDMEVRLAFEENVASTRAESKTRKESECKSILFRDFLLQGSGTGVVFSHAIELLSSNSASAKVPNLKYSGRLHSVHHVYELPDQHPLLDGMDIREVDDPCMYLLAIWSAGENPTAPTSVDQTGAEVEISKSVYEQDKVRGTFLVPCRTAVRGRFPLNGTYFQINEVFADHASSLHPVEVPRNMLWNLNRRFVYFGSSMRAIFRGLSLDEIQACFCQGYVCVRAFDSHTRAPKPLATGFHSSARTKG